ncbi:MAG: FAD-dependent oxidoreductase [Kiritimatiellaeota bacterium]|nr:FAD-dependent oxidoreductase [Kiritimatiellota bacterium]
MANVRKVPCVVNTVTSHGEQVYTITLTPEFPLPQFKPGQFAHLALDEYDPSSFWPESRVFSLASSPAERMQLVLCYAVKGVFTGRMERELTPDKRVWVKLPYGDLIVGNESHVVLFAGGTGISAFTAFLGGLSAERIGQVALYYGVRQPSLLLFREQIETAAIRCPQLRVRYLSERDAIPPVEKTPSRIHCGAGRLAGALALADGFEPTVTTFYLSGPPVMLENLTAQLLAAGVPIKNMATTWPWKIWRHSIMIKEFCSRVILDSKVPG